MTEAKHDGLAIPGKVVLAHELPFHLGLARVTPATRHIEVLQHRLTLEPRVMQVLVVLARAEGAVVTRDDLIQQCWDGRILSDDVVNRVISRLRQVAATAGMGTFAIETIPKVGYRMSREAQSQTAQIAQLEQPFTTSHLQPSRRALVAGTVAVVGIGAAGVMWRVRRPHRPPAEAEDLYRRGDLAQRVGIPSQARQAVSYLEQAVRIDPNYGAAWGALALAYTHTLDGFSEAEMASLAGRIRAAALRSLALEPDNPDAQLALASLTPFFRHWSESEARHRDLIRRFPDHWLCHGRFAMLLRQVGRLNEAIVHQLRVIAIDPMIPPAYGFTVRALSSAGRVQEADAMLKRAEDRWPAHPMLWFVKYMHLLTTGRPRSAAAFVMEPDSLPSGYGPADVKPLQTLAAAVETGDPGEVDTALRNQIAAAQTDVGATTDAVPIFALLGRPDLVFAALDRYLLNRGTFGPSVPIGPTTRRWTDMLFTSPMMPARLDERFADLTRRIGLDEYWRTSGTKPDFRST